MQYTIMLTKEEDGRYSVEVPSLPAVATYGNDLAHALAMARDAIECYLESLALDDLPAPPDNLHFVVN
ncbi:MAG: type II toxin-antitoxin system HicB family antitoxin [Armatimonadetes bacterium]|nr:type II toxin-antitoxin system HicB family antitoxin [Armatimonadota bacterium]